MDLPIFIVNLSHPKISPVLSVRKNLVSLPMGLSPPRIRLRWCLQDRPDWPVFHGLFHRGTPIAGWLMYVMENPI